MKFLSLGLLIIISYLPNSSVLYAATDDDMVLWVSIYDKDKSDIVSYFRYDMTVAEWQAYGEALMDAVVYQKFQTDKYKLQRVSANSCYIFYSEVEPKGNMRTYLATHSSKEKLQSTYSMIERNKYSIIDEGCLSGAGSIQRSSHAIEQKPNKGSILNLFDNAGFASTPRGMYDCPELDEGQVELVILRDGRYYLKNENGTKKIDIRSLSKPYGNDEKVIAAAQKTILEGISFACTFSDEQKGSIFDNVSFNVIKHFLVQALSDCRASKGDEHATCQALAERESKIKQKASLGVRD